MTEADYIVYVNRVARSASTRFPDVVFEPTSTGSCWVILSTPRGSVTGKVWLGRMPADNTLMPDVRLLSGPSVTGSLNDVDAVMTAYDRLAAALEYVGKRLHETAVTFDGLPPDDETDTALYEEDDDG